MNEEWEWINFSDVVLGDTLRYRGEEDQPLFVVTRIEILGQILVFHTSDTSKLIQGMGFSVIERMKGAH